MAATHELAALLTGLQPPPLQEVNNGCLLQPQVAVAFVALQQAALEQGFRLQLVSGYRGFAHQCRIWQAKWQAQRAVFDLKQQLVDVSKLAAPERLHAIALFSALPGTSRHHWGTDLDWYDAAAVAADYQPKLQPSEYETGPFAAAAQFVAEHGPRFGFSQPYARYQGGVAAEPWHLSYLPLASDYLAALTESMVAEALLQSSLDDKEQLVALLPEVFKRYVRNLS